jgi:hypothetical protein
MARGTSLRQSAITRVLRAAKAAGMDVGRFEVDPETGKIVVFASDGSKNERVNGEVEQWLEKHAH